MSSENDCPLHRHFLQGKTPTLAISQCGMLRRARGEQLRGTEMIKNLLLALACAWLTAPASAKAGSHGGGSHASSGGSHAIKGHTSKSGTYVAPTRATNPNRTKADNYSSKGNVNPATGKAGTKDPGK